MKKILFFCIIFSISLLFGNDILLKTKTVIEGNEVYLKDVILSHNLQSIQIDRIKNIIIRTLPDDNNFCNISSKSIARLLNYYVDEEIKIKGGLCSVRKKNKTILPESIRIAARKFISKKLKNEKVHITFYSIPKIVKPPKDFDIL
ncbi:MAG: hypothetical protein U9N34_10325, partial [Candidatus Cloacimonadota bacterium]|nr:hypothetical protein [Candidatus Cloacimonadota bacterium]